MTTLDFSSTSADGLRPIVDPIISVTTIIANLGSHPTVTMPVFTGETPDVNWTWNYLHEPADFFGMTMPTREELRSAYERFNARSAEGSERSLLAVTVMLIEVNGRPQFVLTGVHAQRFDPTPVRLAVGSDATWPTPSAADPVWRRMAARTASRGDVDQLRRWLNGNGFADIVNRREGSMIGPPAMGTLIFDDGSRPIGLDNPVPTSPIELMQRCGALDAGISTEHDEIDASGPVSAAWWISPLFGVHPVDQIGDEHYAVEVGVPPTFLGRPS